MVAASIESFQQGDIQSSVLSFAKICKDFAPAPSEAAPSIPTSAIGPPFRYPTSFNCAIKKWRSQRAVDFPAFVDAA